MNKILTIFLLTASIATAQNDSTLILDSHFKLADTTSLKTAGISFSGNTIVVKPMMQNRIYTIQMDWIIIAGADGILRKQSDVAVVKKYKHFGTLLYTDPDPNFYTLTGESIDVVLYKMKDDR